MIFLVVAIHAGGVYESSGVWASFWIVDDPSTNNLSGLLFLLLDIFTMPTIFFISGFFAYSSVKNYRGWEFLKSKFKRLTIPWIVAVLTLIPLYKIIFLYSRNLPQESWTTYFHWSNGIWSQNWLWFSFHLSLLCLMYVAIETFRRYLDKRHMITDELNRNSYYVYIIHVVVMGSFALLLLNSGIPSLLKHLSLTVLTFGVSNLIISSCRRYINCRILNVRMAESRIKTITTAALIVTLLTVAGCPKQENSDRKERPPHLNLHAAALEGHLDVICRHIGAGSDLNRKDPYGSSPLIVAVTFGKTEVARALIDAGADMRITNNEGSTPLHIAAFLCRTEIVKDLLDKGADRTLRNQAGRTALESVSRPFDEVEGIYDGLGAALAPLGLKLDYERIKMTRPSIVEMLR